MKILCIIPARSGSKGIKHKNIKLLNGKPLIAHSIEQALNSKHYKDMKVIVSTDSLQYAEISKKYGAEVPFLRPRNISLDLSTDEEFINHAVNYLMEKEDYNSDIILQLRPTYPTRKVEIIDNCLDLFIENRDKYDSLRTVIPYDKSPYKMYRIINNSLIPLFYEIYKNNEIIKEPFNQCRQLLHSTYLHNGYIDILNTSILKKETISGTKIYPYLMDKSEYHDIDTEEDFKIIENYFF